MRQNWKGNVPDYCPVFMGFKYFLEPLKRICTQLFGRMPQASKAGGKIISANEEAFIMLVLLKYINVSVRLILINWN